MTEILIDKKAQTMIEGIAALDWHGTIDTEDEQKSAAQFLSGIKAEAKVLKTKKEAITKPLNAALKEVRNQFKPAEERIEHIEQTIKAAMLEYHDKQEVFAQQKVAAIESRVKPGKGNLSLESAMGRLADVDQPETNMQGAQIKYGPEKVVVIDPLLVPQMYLYDPEVIDAIRKVIARDIKAGAPVPVGVKMVREKLVAGIA